jgi:hypothetical protein
MRKAESCAGRSVGPDLGSPEHAQPPAARRPCGTDPPGRSVLCPRCKGCSPAARARARRRQARSTAAGRPTGNCPPSLLSVLAGTDGDAPQLTPSTNRRITDQTALVEADDAGAFAPLRAGALARCSPTPPVRTDDAPAGLPTFGTPEQRPRVVSRVFEHVRAGLGAHEQDGPCVVDGPRRPALIATARGGCPSGPRRPRAHRRGRPRRRGWAAPRPASRSRRRRRNHRTSASCARIAARP